jgi:hypothetical protein
MKAVLLEQFGSKQGIKKKVISDSRIQKILKKKRQKKFEARYKKNEA